MDLTIRDQRTMVGVERLEDAHLTVDDVTAAWQAWADQHGFTLRAREGDYSREFRRSRVVLAAYIDGGAWYASCAKCNGGIAAWPDHDHGACLDCGTIYPIAFPPPADIQRAINTLALRDPRDRNWHVHLGETIGYLEVETKAIVAARARETFGTEAVTLNTISDVLGAQAVDRLRNAGAL